MEKGSLASPFSSGTGRSLYCFLFRQIHPFAVNKNGTGKVTIFHFQQETMSE